MKNPLLSAALALLAWVAIPQALPAAPSLERLHVSDNHRFLITESGQPFSWGGDTAWLMFGKSPAGRFVQGAPEPDCRAEGEDMVVQSAHG